MDYYASFRVVRQFNLVQYIPGDILLYPQMTWEIARWGPTVSPLEGRTNFQSMPYLVWDERRGPGEDPGTTSGCMS